MFLSKKQAAEAKSCANKERIIADCSGGQLQEAGNMFTGIVCCWSSQCPLSSANVIAIKSWLSQIKWIRECLFMRTFGMNNMWHNFWRVTLMKPLPFTEEYILLLASQNMNLFPQLGKQHSWALTCQHVSISTVYLCIASRKPTGWIKGLPETRVYLGVHQTPSLACQRTCLQASTKIKFSGLKTFFTV